MNLTNVLCSILTKDLLPSSLCWVSCTQFHPINSFWWWTNSNQHSSPSLKGGNLYSRLSTGHFLSNVPKWRKTWQLSFSHPCFFSPPSPLTSVPGFILSTFFSPLSRSSPQRRPRTPPPPSLTPLSHVFSTLSACVDDPSKCIVCPFMFCIFYSPAELLSCFFKIDFKIDLRRSHFIGLQKGCKHILLKLSLSPKNSFSTFIWSICSWGAASVVVHLIRKLCLLLRLRIPTKQWKHGIGCKLCPNLYFKVTESLTVVTN